MLNLIKKTRNLKLLYVEDEDITRIMSEVLLEELFEDVIMACDGQDGLEKFKENDIDIVLTDITMPILNGLDMAKEIKKIDKDVPIIVFSARRDEKYFDEAEDIRVFDYLLKPLNFNEFVKVLGSCIEHIQEIKKIK